MATQTSNQGPSGPTEELSRWVASVSLKDIPEDIRIRTKYLILDGLACGLMAAHLPASEKAAKAMFDMEPTGGVATVIGWGGKKLTPLSAALLNSTFVQGFELDDWHSEAPLHSNSILLPALLAAAQHSSQPVSGPDFLLATIVGYEVGPRVGNALHGAHILTTGWHSGAVFGPSAAAASTGKLLGLDAGQIEDAFGIACTQACGLMSAQYESEVKRMQHGFAARNGLLGVLLARNGFIGIKKVYEREYGGFLKQFSLGNGKEPAYLLDRLVEGLGSTWKTNHIRVKPYASMAGTHSTIDCVRGLQEQYPEIMQNKIKEIKKIHCTMGAVEYHHGGWKTTRPLTSTGGQMSCAFTAATQIIHGQVLAAQFRHDMLENDDVWKLVDVTDCEEDTERPLGRQKMAIEFQDGTVLTHEVEAARGVAPPFSNEEIIVKWRMLTKDIMDAGKAKQIEDTVLSLDTLEDISPLYDLLSTVTKNPIE